MNNNNNNNIVSVLYGDSRQRKAMTKAERDEATRQYIEYTSNNHKDDGKQGKIYEVLTRNLIVPNSIILKVQGLGKNDITFKNKVTNKMQSLEVKTGGGTLFYNIELGDNWRDILTKDVLIELLEQQFNYILYNVFFDGTSKTFNNGRVFTPKEYVNFLNDYDNGFQSMISYKSKEKKLVIANPKASKKRIKFYEDIKNYGIDIFEFMDKMGL